MFKYLLLWIKMPAKFALFYTNYKEREFTLLDIGCGNHSPRKTKEIFPNCRYHGLDIIRYNNDEADMRMMERFYEINLNDIDKLDILPDNCYDVILFSHVIEHLTEGLDVLKKIVNKLKIGGLIYIEFPSIKSLSLPSMPDTLNFCDDPTHIKLYDIKEISNTLLSNNCKIVKASKRRYWRRILLFPLMFIRNYKNPATAFWDIMGFADYVYAQKIK